ncbi:MAG: bifunctional tetrahydrofolate synthase/dihydrofolate synthase [Pseudomonadota bacterium]
MRFQNLDEWLDWQSTLHPAEIELGLERVSVVWRRLHPTGLTSKVITIAGTNGKGSNAAMLETIYLQAGYRVGLYTSPHLIRYNERIRTNGAEVSDAALCAAFENVDQARNGISLTYFEFGTLAALDIFAADPPDLIILEVGLGGRLDAVNIIDPDLAIITTVDLDHTDWLGETREQIGLEKAGIMRAGRPVILGAPSMPGTVLQQAADLGAQCFQFGRDFRIEPHAEGFSWHGQHHQQRFNTRPSLLGDFQLQNAASVLMAVECLSDCLPVRQAAIEQAMKTSRLKGRLQIIEGDIPIILDVAHNPQAVMALRDNLPEYLDEIRLHAVFGLLSDKDVESIIDIIGPSIESWHLVGIESERGQSAAQLQACLEAAGIERIIGSYDSVAKALNSARSTAEPGDAVLVFGSFVIVGEALGMLEKPGQLS